MSLFWLIHYARAADYNLIQPLPGVQTVSSFPQYIESIIPFILSLAAILAVVMIIIGGVEYAVSLSEEGKKNAKGRINNAILGLLLALVSYLILYTINPALVNLELGIPPLTSTVEIKICTPKCKIGEEICVDGTCKILSGGNTGGNSSQPPTVIQPPAPKIVDVCPNGGSCEKAISLPPTSPVEKKVIVADGQFDKATEQKIQELLDKVYNKIPYDYKSLKKSVSILNRAAMNEVSKLAGIETSRGFVAHNNKFVDGVFLLGDDANQKNIYEIISGQKTGFETEFERTMIHELSHALAAEKFNKFDGDTEWRNLYETSKKENRGFALPELLSADLVSPYASVNPAEDMGTTVEAYVFTSGKYKTGDKRSDEILAQKFTWLEKNGLVKKMR